MIELLLCRAAPPVVVMLITLLFGISNGYLTVGILTTAPIGYQAREQNLVGIPGSLPFTPHKICTCNAQ